MSNLTNQNLKDLNELDVTITNELGKNREFYEASTTTDQIIARCVNESDLINEFSHEEIMVHILEVA